MAGGSLGDDENSNSVCSMDCRPLLYLVLPLQAQDYESEPFSVGVRFLDREPAVIYSLPLAFL
jgi:hypothetical protein